LKRINLFIIFISIYASFAHSQVCRMIGQDPQCRFFDTDSTTTAGGYNRYIIKNADLTLETNTSSLNNFNTYRKVGSLGVVSVKSYGAKCDSSADDTEAIQSALNDAVEYGGAVLIPSGKCIVTAPLTINSTTNNQVMLIGQGSHSILSNSNSASYDILTLEGAGSITIKDMRFEQAVGGSTTKAAIKVLLTSDITITDNWIYGFYDGIYIDRADNVRVSNNTIEGQAHAGLYGNQPFLNSIINNTFYRCSEASGKSGGAIMGIKQSDYNFAPAGNKIIGNYFYKTLYGPAISLIGFGPTSITGNSFAYSSDFDPGHYADIELSLSYGIIVNSNVHHSIDNDYIPGSQGSKYCINFGNSSVSEYSNNHCEIGTAEAVLNSSGYHNKIFGNQYTYSGTVNTSGTAVSWVNGAKFGAGFVTGPIRINGVNYTVSSFNSDVSLTLSGSAGNQTSVQYVWEYVHDELLSGITLADTTKATGTIMSSGGLDANTTYPAYGLANNKTISWKDSSATYTHGAYLWYDTSNALHIGTNNTDQLVLDANGNIIYTPIAFASLGSVVNGAIRFCPNCKPTSSINFTCILDSSGTPPGSYVFGMGSTWQCISNTPGSGVTASGSSCAITGITNGIITEATCAP
jgi:parallel beta-helix repeat protein